MKAMVFAAGLGTRLYPLTKDMPKALVKIDQKPILEIVIKFLCYYGFNEIIVNVHHFSDMICSFLKENNNFNANIYISDESDQLLETGGGLKKAAWFFKDNQPFLVYNADILTTIDLSEMLKAHLLNNCLATLAVQNRESSRSFLFNSDKKLCGWRDTKNKKEILSRNTNLSITPFSFSGIHIINPSIFPLLTEDGVFSIRDSYIRLASNYDICSYEHTNSDWIDIGSPEKLNEAKSFLKKLSFLSL